MNNEFKRTDRIAQIIQRRLAEIIQQEIQDPRLPKIITVSAVTVTKDLSHAKIYFTALNDEARVADVILNNASRYLRTALAQILTLRTVPQLHFIYDESVEYGQRLSRLIDKVSDQEQDDEP